MRNKCNMHESVEETPQKCFTNSDLYLEIPTFNLEFQDTSIFVVSFLRFRKYVVINIMLC